METEVYGLVVRAAAAQGLTVDQLDRVTLQELESVAREQVCVAMMISGKVRPGGPDVADQIAGALGMSRFEAMVLMRKPTVVRQAREATSVTAILVAQEAAEAFRDSLDKLKFIGDNAESESVQQAAHSDRAKFSLDVLKMTMAQQAAQAETSSPGSVVVNVNTQNNNNTLGPLPELPAGGIRG